MATPGLAGSRIGAGAFLPVAVMAAVGGCSPLGPPLLASYQDTFARTGARSRR